MAYLTIKEVATIEVRVGDINYGNHMGNDRALLVFQDARIRYLERIGFSEHNIGYGTGITIRDAHVTYRREVFLHDVLLVDVGIEDVRTMSFNMVYTVRRKSDEAVVFTGSTGIVALNYDSRRPVKIPDEFLEKITLK